MNLKQVQKNLDNVKNITPEIYKDTMKVSLPFFVLHTKIYNEGEDVILKECDLNQTELDILTTLYYVSNDSHTLSPTELYDTMLFSSGGMTKVLKKLESKNYIKRIDNKEDKRSKLVQITEFGKEITAKALKDIVAYEDKYFSKLDINEQEQLKNLLYKMLHT